MITVSSKNSFYAPERDMAYRVIKGSAYVYIQETTYDGENASAFLTEVNVGDAIPGCYIVKRLKDSLFEFAFSISSEDEAQLEEIECTREIRDKFIDNVFPGNSGDALENCVYDFVIDYIRHMIRITEGVYKSYNEANENILQNIKSAVESEKASNFIMTDNNLYNAIARICEWESIDCTSYKDIRKCCKDKIKPEDVARISGFAIREIVLSHGWEKQEFGSALVYYGDNKPAALLKKRTGGYVLWDPESGENLELTGELVASVDSHAVMLYRSFPKENMKFKDLFRFAMHDFRVYDAVMLFVLMLAETLIGILLPTMNQKIYDIFIPTGDSGGLLGLGVVIFACTLGNVAFGLVKTFTNFRCFTRMKYSVQAATYDRLFNLPISFFRNYDSAELAQRATGVAEIFDLISQSIFLTGFSVLLSFFYLAKMIKYSKKLAGGAVIILLIAMAIIWFLGFLQKKNQALKKDLNAKQSSILYQLILAIEKLRISGAETRGLAKYMNIYSQTARTERNIEVLNNWNSIVNVSVSTISSMIFYYLMVRKDLGLTMGTFVAFTTAYSAFSSAMLGLVSTSISLSSLIPAYDHLRPILETAPEVAEDAILPGEITGDIRLDHVSFGYRPEHTIVNDIDLHIKSGEYVGLVGASGGGKSTLFKLLLGFETPNHGKIYYDDMDIENTNKKELRKQFGVVLQNGSLITGTIYDNVTVTNPDATEEEVLQALKDVGLEEDIEKMPMGLNSLISEGSGGISGGQKQRLLIARALVGKPKVLFFDEATSALDNRTQQQVGASIAKLTCTKFVIAHRIVTIMNCDRILVMDKGRIVESGTYDELMDQQGLFYELAKRQIS